jgi:hypothetical protein
MTRSRIPIRPWPRPSGTGAPTPSSAGGPLELLPRATLIAGVGAVTIAALADASARSPRATPAGPQTIQLVERGGGVTFVDNPPKARHRYQFSAGDITIVSRGLYQQNKRVGAIRLACLFTSASTDHCTGTATLPGGTIEFAEISNPQPTTNVATTGGTHL